MRPDGTLLVDTTQRAPEVEEAEVVASHRIVSASDRNPVPGGKVRGTVQLRIRSLVLCEACGTLRFEGPWPHAPHLNEHGIMVDCAGALVMSDGDA